MKHTRLAAVCLVASGVWACQKQTEQPSMADEKIAEVMADLSLAEAATLGLYGAPKDSLIQFYAEQVFKIHHTSLEEHDKNLKIIGQDIDRLREILKKSEEILKEKSGQTGVREKAQSLGQN